MVLRNVTYVRAQDMTPAQRDELGIRTDVGLVAIETHNTVYSQRAVRVTRGILNYIMQGV